VRYRTSVCARERARIHIAAITREFLYGKGRNSVRPMLVASRKNREMRGTARTLRNGPLAVLRKLENERDPTAASYYM